jgi:hypothetical protein
MSRVLAVKKTKVPKKKVTKGIKKQTKAKITKSSPQKKVP